MPEPCDGLPAVFPKATRLEMRAWSVRAVVFTGTGVKRSASGTVEVLKARSGSFSARHAFRLRQVTPSPGVPSGTESGNQ